MIGPYKNLYFATDLHLSSASPSSRVDDYLASIFKKLEYVLGQAMSNDGIVVLGGDIFHTPSQPDYVKNMLINMIGASGVPVFAIWGNHDLLYYNMEHADRCSLELIFNSKVIAKLTQLSLDGWNLIGHEMMTPFPKDLPKKSIVFTHSYHKKQYADKLFITDEEITQSGAYAIFLGHDHKQYPFVVVNKKTVLVRPGALSRGTSSSENEERDPSCAVLNLGTGKIKLEIVPHRPFNEVFRDKFDSSQERTTVSFEDIKNYIQELNSKEVNIDVFSILAAMQLDDETYQRSCSYLEQVGLSSK